MSPLGYEHSGGDYAGASGRERPSAREVPIGSFWGGGGMTVQILAEWQDGYSVLRLTGRGRILKRPQRAFMPAQSFNDGRMKPTTFPPTFARLDSSSVERATKPKTSRGGAR